jgi:hypothetical protein
MNKKKVRKVSDVISQIRTSLISNSSEDTSIPDIITFVDDDRYLGLGSPRNKIRLYTAQRVILKAFYRGSRGNENLQLTEEEIEWCKKNGLTDGNPDHGCGDILGKIATNHQFRELVLVWGRRSGKDFLASIIALYEAMRLLSSPGGDPYQYYELAPGASITILTIAASESQANIAFREIKEKLIYSKYFADKYVPEGIQSQEIWLMTPKDKEDNVLFEEKGMPLKRGSVKIQVGHSNPDTLVGISCFVLILDEVASYKIGTSGAGSGDKIYSMLQPTVATYVRKVAKVDESGASVIDKSTGEQEVEYVYEGKIISISSPRAKEGKLWELWYSTPEATNRLACRMPTWTVTDNKYSRKSLRQEFMNMSEEEFNMEFGAEFSGTAGESMFPADLVTNLFKNNLQFRDIGEPGKTYFVHLDPATNSHNYALVVCHKEIFLDPTTRKSDFHVIVDLIKFWSPDGDKMIEISQIDDYVCSLKRRFHLGMVSYDQWNSQSSIQKLRKYGIPAIMTRFNRTYKMAIYSELEELIKSGKLKCPYHPVLKSEMLYLLRRYDANGWKVFPKKEGDTPKTDDIVDALAGACYHAVSQDQKRLPHGRLVNTGVVPSANNVVWRSMQGIPYGVGTGQQVSKRLERIHAWPKRMR